MRARGTFARLVMTMGRRQCYVNVCGCDSGWRWGTCGRDRAQYILNNIFTWNDYFLTHFTITLRLRSVSLSKTKIWNILNDLCLCDLYDRALLGVWGGWGCYNVTSWHDPEREMTDKHGYMTGHMMSQYTHHWYPHTLDIPGDTSQHDQLRQLSYYYLRLFTI